MTDSKHTPAPWHVNKLQRSARNPFNIIEKHRGRKAVIKIMPQDCYTEKAGELKRNQLANLTAAAPELLEALEGILQIWAHLGTHEEIKQKILEEGLENAMSEKHLLNAIKAIRKAKGE